MATTDNMCLGQQWQIKQKEKPTVLEDGLKELIEKRVKEQMDRNLCSLIVGFDDHRQYDASLHLAIKIWLHESHKNILCHSRIQSNRLLDYL